MRGREDRRCHVLRAGLLHLVERHVGALAEQIDIALRGMRGDIEHTLAVDLDSAHCISLLLRKFLLRREAKLLDDPAPMVLLGANEFAGRLR